MARKKSNKKEVGAQVQSILCEVFVNGATSVRIEDNEKRKAVEAELTKFGIKYSLWDVPVTENEHLVRYEKRIVVKDAQQLADVLNDLQHGGNQTEKGNA